jgi:transposase
MWCIPEVSAEFVAHMEDVLDVYEQAYDPSRPVVCMDETPKQLIGEVRQPLPMQPGQPLRYDSEYRRNGTCNLFLFCEPKRAWREIVLTEQRTLQDFAWGIKWLLDVVYPQAEVVRLVLDNLNTHRPAALYETFAPEEARRLLKRLEWHYTPKHGSWLNMAEIEFSVLHNLCTNRRIPDANTLKTEVAAFVCERNNQQATIRWRFTSTDARTKLRHLYPSISH